MFIELMLCCLFFDCVVCSWFWKVGFPVIALFWWVLLLIAVYFLISLIPFWFLLLNGV